MSGVGDGRVSALIPQGGSNATTYAREKGKQRWLSDLGDLLAGAEYRFGDVCWQSTDGSKTWAHKAIVYARSTAPFQSRYLGSCHLAGDSAYLSSLNLSTSSHGFLSPTPSSAGMGIVRAHSPTSVTSFPASSEGGHAPSAAFTLISTEHALLRPALEIMYTGRGMQDVFAFLFEDGHSIPSEEEAIDKLQQDLLFLWRSKLYSDVQLHIAGDEGAEQKMPFGEQGGDSEEDETVYFTSHRAILTARCPYFTALLSGYADSSARLLTLPAAVFTPAALHFLLGAIYCGNLDFSPRRFDLATGCEIIRGAQYLEMDLVKAEAEACVADLCHGWKGCCKTCARRSAYVLLFSQRSDLNGVGARLKQSSQPVVVKLWNEAWTHSEIADLPPELREQLASEVAGSINAENAVAMLGQALALRSRLSNTSGRWRDKIVDMLIVVEGRIRSVVVSSLASVVESDSFTELLDGQFFALSREVLSKMLDNFVSDLTEASTPSAYQVLTGSVLLREDGLPIDARVLVDDARLAIVKLLKQRWISIRANDGFETLENWALKEIADELEMPVDDLLNHPVAPSTVTKKGLIAAAKRSDADSLSLRSSVLNRSAAKAASASSVSARSVKTSIASAPSAVRNPKPSEATVVSPKSGTAIASRTAAARRSTLQPAVPSRTSSSRSRTPSPVPPSQTSVETEQSQIKEEQGLAPAAEIKPSAHRTGASVELAPSIKSVRSPVLSRGGARGARGSSPRGRASPKGARTRTACVATLQSSAPSQRTPASPKTPRTTQTRQPLGSSSPQISVTSSSPVKMLSRSPSIATTRSTASGASSSPKTVRVRQESIASVRTTTTTRTTATSRTVDAARPNTTASRQATEASERRAALRAAASSASLGTKGKVKGAAAIKSSAAFTTPMRGTALRVPLPALVSLPNGIKAKAMVHFLGKTHLGAGDWVGVCVEEAGLPSEAKGDAGIHWCDGTMDEYAYFSGPHDRCAFVQPSQVLFLFPSSS